LVSIKELARKVSAMLGSGDCQALNVDDQGWNLGRYVSDTSQIGRDLELYKTVSLDEEILRTALWNGWKEES
jgi:dTDP-glucose 4,6-dehydratase